MELTLPDCWDLIEITASKITARAIILDLVYWDQHKLGLRFYGYPNLSTFGPRVA
jgi:hypothetical protein